MSIFVGVALIAIALELVRQAAKHGEQVINISALGTAIAGILLLTGVI